jgi:PAS domain S-box-containing protein
MHGTAVADDAAPPIPSGIGNEFRSQSLPRHSIETLATAVADALFDIRSGGGRAFVLVRVFRLDALGESPSDRPLRLVATRGEHPEWNDVARSESHRLLVFAPGSFEADATFHIPDATASERAHANAVREHGIVSVSGFRADASADVALVVVAFSRFSICSQSLRSLELLCLRTKRALLDTTEMRSALDDEARSAAHVAALERMTALQEAHAEDVARETKRVLLIQRAETAAEVARGEAELLEQNEKLRRTQRAMLNVIDDLREARATLETRVAERTRRLLEILEETQDSFFALDQNFRFVMMNARHEAMLGVSRESSLGRSYFEVFETAPTSKFRTELHRTRDERVPTSFVEHHGTRDLWVEVSATPSSDGGVAVFYRDITARVRLEREREELLAKEKRARIDAEAAWAQAESANRAKDEFLSTVSHELRTPLNAILGWSHLLRGDALEPAKRTTALETIERNARAQVRLVDDLLDFGRILQGKFKLAVAPVEVVSVVDAALQTVKPAADAKGVRIQSTLDSDTTISGDAERLQQIVWNLASNAIKFTERGGRVDVTLRRTNSHVELIVADDGQGIAKSFLPHVFEPFRQADGAMTRRAGGLGLGLSIVRSLVELHGGTVSVTSEGEGRGATFTVRIPNSPTRSEPPPSEAEAPASDRPPFDRPAALAGIRALVVDDEKDTRELVAFVLQQCNAEVTSVASTRDAMLELEQSPFDVLISDVGMPDEDGLSMMRRLRTREPAHGGRIPAVALTAYSRTEDRAEAIRAGFDTHLAKPVDASELALIVAAVLRNRP